MQTLDEVIEDVDYLNDDNHKCDNCQWEKQRFICSRDQCVYLDALHYLKEYHEHLKWQTYAEHYLAEEKKKIKQAYEQGYAQAKHDDEVTRRWEESYRQSQMPWNQGYCEMGG